MINFLKPLSPVTKETCNKLNIIYNKASLDSKLAAIMAGYTLRKEYPNIYFYEYNRVLNTCKLVSKPFLEEVNTNRPDGGSFVRGDGSLFIYTCTPSAAQLSAHSDKDVIHIYNNDSFVTFYMDTPKEGDEKSSANYEYRVYNSEELTDVDCDEDRIHNPANLITLNTLNGLGYTDDDITSNSSFHYLVMVLADNELNLVRGNSITTSIKIESCLFNKNKQLDECIEKFNFPEHPCFSISAEEFSVVDESIRAKYIQYLNQIKDLIEITRKSTIISPWSTNGSSWNLPNISILGNSLLIVPYVVVDEQDAKTLMRIASYSIPDFIAVQCYTDSTLVRIHSVKNTEWMCGCYNYTDRWIQNGYTYLKVPNKPALK